MAATATCPATGYEHHAVAHSGGEYMRGMAHTNGIGSFRALLKRGYTGIFHHMSGKHFHRYVNAFAGRHNMGQDTLACLDRGLS